MAAKILVVDDDADVVELIRQTLEENGYQVWSAYTGTEALRKAQTVRPDLILLDLMLPEMNGFNVCETLRRERATADIPVLILTALPGDFPRLAGLEAGANGFLSKPFPLSDLLQKVSQLLERRPLIPPLCAPLPRPSAAVLAT